MPSEIQTQQVADVLGLKTPKGVSSLWLFQVIREGLPLRALETIQNTIAPNASELRSLFVSEATLKRRRRAHQRFSAVESQKIERAARAWAMAVDVFGDADKARKFLLTPHPMLNMERPLQVATENDVGSDMVETLLGRVKYGIPA